MPKWLLPAGIGIATWFAAMWGLGAAADTAGIRLWHNDGHFDAFGDYREGGSTRAGFLVGLLSFGLGCWAAGFTSTGKVGCGMSARDWQLAGVVLGALFVYVILMHLLTVTFGRQTRSLPDFVFNLLDLGVLCACGYAGYRVLRRARR